MNRVSTGYVINEFVFIMNVVVGVDVNHADVVVQRGSFGMTLHKQPEHRVVAMGIPPRKKDDMFPAVVHYLISMISASG